jgi:hypothetical protein
MRLIVSLKYRNMNVILMFTPGHTRITFMFRAAAAAGWVMAGGRRRGAGGADG